jgi:UDP-N-acetyl-D-glucosamine dehydrogenase
VRETPAAEIIKLLADQGADVSYHDPYVPSFPSMRKYNFRMDSADLTPEYLRRCACVVICTDHGNVDWQMIADEAPLVVDTRNTMARLSRVKATVVPA